MARPRVVGDDALLDRAMHLFWRSGYANTGIRELERALGLKAPGIYNRFGSKDGLFQAALDYYLDKVIGWRIEHYLEASDPLLGLRKFFDTTYSYISADRPALSCLLVNTSLEIGPRNIPVHGLLEKGVETLRTALGDNLRRAQTMGQVRADADVPTLARHLLLCLHGLTVAGNIETDKATLSRQVDVIFSALPLRQGPSAHTAEPEPNLPAAFEQDAHIGSGN